MNTFINQFIVLKCMFSVFIFSMPRQIYDFVPIAKMEKFQIEDRGKKMVDVCGIIKSADMDCTTLTSKTTGKEMFKVCCDFTCENTVSKNNFRENSLLWTSQRHRFH